MASVMTGTTIANRERDGENSGDGAHGADEPAPRADRRHVAVADGRHRHDRPPERVRDTAARPHTHTHTHVYSQFYCLYPFRLLHV